MKVATWNVNSVRARKERVLAFLERQEPDVLCLQELKVTDELFPCDDFRELGYHAATHGQKTYNGVAILSRSELRNVRSSLDDDVEDPQARLIAATVDGVRILSAYFPNGGEVDGPRYPFKLAWMTRLRSYLDRHHEPSEPLLLCGDSNVAIDDLDIAMPDYWADSVLTHADVRRGLAEIGDFGLVDVFRQQHPEGGIFSWWDYRRLAFPKGDGLRIDHIFATADLAAKCTGAEVDRNERKGKGASDHAPVLATFEET